MKRKRKCRNAKANLNLTWLSTKIAPSPVKWSGGDNFYLHVNSILELFMKTMFNKVNYIFNESLNT